MSGIVWYEQGRTQEALNRAGREGRPLLVDFYTPGCVGCTAMDARTYPAAQVQALLAAEFICVKYDTHRADADLPKLSPAAPPLWTPTLVVLDSGLSEVRRLVGSLPADELVAELEVALALIALRRRQLDEAIELLRGVADRVPPPSAGAEALYWAGVAAYYRAGQCHSALACWWKEIGARYPRSAWWARADVLAALDADATAA